MMKKNFLFVAFLLIFATYFLSAQEIDSTSYYKSIYYKGNAKIEFNDQMHNCQFNFVNVIDSFMYIQLNIAGIEILRAFVTPDKILIINKLDRSYYDGDYFTLQTITNIDFDFYMLQDVFNGAPEPLPYNASVSYSGELNVDEYTFFKFLHFEHELIALKLDIKKVTFDEVPTVSATIPKNFTPMNF